jgi:TetR/AcrR family transcriptional repressor of nem operon
MASTSTEPAGTDGRWRTSDQAQRILDVAERLVQSRGFNGFSYADVAADLHVTKASLHYHFPSKAELGEALISRYTERFAEALAGIDAHGRGPADRLEAYVGLYAEVLRGRRICLCGMLAAEYQTLPEPMQRAVAAFLAVNQAWLENVLNDGRGAGSLSFAGPSATGARMIVSGLQGAMLVARPDPDAEGFLVTARGLLTSIAGIDGAGPRGQL